MYVPRPARGAASKIDGARRRSRPRDRKLEAEVVYDLRIRALDGETHERLAAEMEVSQSTVTRAIQGQTYRWVTHPVQWYGWSPGNPPAMRFMDFGLAQAKFEHAGDVDAIIERPAPRITMRDVFGMLDEWERRDEADGTAELRAQRRFAEYDRMVRAMIDKVNEDAARRQPAS